MKNLIAAAVLTGSLLTGAGSAMALPLGGLADPLGLAGDGVLLPYITGGPLGFVSTIAVASPVAANPRLTMFFFDEHCARVGRAVTLPETENDIAFVHLAQPEGNPVVPPNTSGLVAIADGHLSPRFPTSLSLAPLTSPIHARTWLFSLLDGTSWILEPIILSAAESTDEKLTWSPLRTGATFYAPLESESVHTTLTLVCPRTTIQGAVGAAFPSGRGGFPLIHPAFNDGATTMIGRVYDTSEVLLRDIMFTCDCLTQISLSSLSSIYASTSDPSNGIGAQLGTYTELEVEAPNLFERTTGSFTGYISNRTLGTVLSSFFGRLSNGGRSSLRGQGGGATR